jgi:regulator of protease activity HflC (stomatin/prohibitin superfamily)
VGWLAGTIVFLILGGLAFIVGRSAAATRVEAERGLVGGRLKAGAYTVAGLMAVGWVILTIVSSIYIIDAGHVGVIKTFGEIDGQVGDGPAFVAPWSDVIEVSTRAQRKEFDALAAFSKETQDVFVDATLNLAVAPGEIQCLYRTVGGDWYDKLIPPRVLQTLKDETVKYSTVEVAPARETIRRNVRERLQTQLAEFRIRAGECSISIDVQDFLIRNIDFRPEFKQAIERKQIATQDAETARNRVRQSEFEAQQQVKKAEGEARATFVKAQAQARANRLLSQSLTPEVVRYAYVQKIAPTVQTILVPQSSDFILPSPSPRATAAP